MNKAILGGRCFVAATKSGIKELMLKGIYRGTTSPSGRSLFLDVCVLFGRLITHATKFPRQNSLGVRQCENAH